MIELSFYIAPIGALLALIFAWVFYRTMKKQSEGTDKMAEIAAYVREGAYAYLYRQYKVVAWAFVILFVILTILAYARVQNPFVPIAFLAGGFFSALCGYLGMVTATDASARTANAARTSLNGALKVAFRSGAVMGLVVVGFGLLFISISYWILDNLVYTAQNMQNGLHFLGLVFVQEGINDAQKLNEVTTTMLTFGMGASTQALFARVGGGIYTKAADVGADLVGKVEEGIPEDDPRNPATVADNVGDNVGDVAGMGADLYESYVASILATAALGAALPTASGQFGGLQAVLAPMVVAGLGIVFSIIGIFAVRTKENATMKNLLASLNVGIWGSSILILIALAVMAAINFITWGVFGSVVAGLVAGIVLGQVTEYYTSDDYPPTQGIAKQGQMGHATTIIEGIAMGMNSSGVAVFTIVVGILAAFGFSGGFENISQGLYGIGFAAVGMLSTLGITLATDAYGPIADNAGGNAEMSGLEPKVREKTDALDMLGNTTAATGKGFAIGSAALTAMALLSAYIEQVRIWLARLANFAAEGFFAVGKFRFYFEEVSKGVKNELAEKGVTAVQAASAEISDFMAAYNVDLMNPKVICGVFLGSMVAFVFSSITMRAVGRAAGDMVEEVRRQFKENPGIMKGETKPDYGRCVRISTAGAQKEMIAPSALAILIPIVTGLILGVGGVIGLLIGSLTTGFSLACMLNNSGGGWDNAKKYIEKGNYGGKGSEAHKAGVTGDTVGDPFKDTSGPSLNILIKLMTMVSVVFAGLVVRFSPAIGEFLNLM